MTSFKDSRPAIERPGITPPFISFQIHKTLGSSGENRTPISAVYAPLQPQQRLLWEKKTAEAIQQEVTHEIGRVLPVILQDQYRNGKLDLEALEAAMRAAMHQAGAVALSQWLQCAPPRLDQRDLACSCGHTARYREMRSRGILTTVGEVKLVRPYYLCSHCHKGQFRLDTHLDVENQDLSPGYVVCWRKWIWTCEQAITADGSCEWK